MMEGLHSEEEEVVEMGILMGGSSSGGGGMSSSSSSSSSSRWNPTKEQISMLENLYKQGLRTPTAEEIQQITARLRVYGHIEGKNVFYWFQNHKARQRQKQKQDSIAYFNRFLHHHHHHQPPLFLPHPAAPQISPNAMCAPYCIPQAHSTEIGFYHQQHPKVLVPVAPRRNNNNPNEKVVVPMGILPPKTTNTRMCTNDVPVSMAYEIMQMQHQQEQQGFSDCNNQETLDLFPLHPTGILEGKSTNNKVVVSSSLASVSADSSTDDTPSAILDHINHEQYGYGSPNQPFFHFFPSGLGPLESG